MEMFVKLNKKIGVYNELSIKVGYEKGGVSYFTSSTQKRGIYIYLKPVLRTDTFTTSRMLGDVYECGFKVLVKETGRRNNKLSEAIFNKLVNSNVSEWLEKWYHLQEFYLISDKLKLIANS